MPRLVKESVTRTLIKMAVPMLAGSFSLSAYNLTDTWFVSRLGTTALAAMAFTFPVVLLLRFVMHGLGTGAMAVVARALGGNKHHTATRLTTHGILLIFIISCLITIAGIMTIRPIFVHLGATGEILSMTRQFMTIWYCGMPVMALQLMLGSVIIGAGNAKAASFLMVAGTLINFILDPIMIFGLIGFPRMEIQGAAIATVLSQAAVLAVAIYIIHTKHQLISFSLYSAKKIFVSWKRILSIGLPSVLSSILTPLSSAVVIAIIASFDSSAVAAFGVASRIEIFAFMIPMTVGMSLIPFVAQNYGAKRFDRIRTARKGAMIFALIFGFITAGLFFIIARPMASLFSNDPDVIRVLVKYICITCFGYGFLEVHRYAGFCMTGIHKPVSSVILNSIRVVLLLIPLSLLGARLFGLSGIFWGRLITDFLCGIIGIVWTGRVLRTMR